MSQQREYKILHKLDQSRKQYNQKLQANWSYNNLEEDTEDGFGKVNWYQEIVEKLIKKTIILQKRINQINTARRDINFGLWKNYLKQVGLRNGISGCQSYTFFKNQKQTNIQTILLINYQIGNIKLEQQQTPTKIDQEAPVLENFLIQNIRKSTIQLVNKRLQSELYDRMKVSQEKDVFNYRKKQTEFIKVKFGKAH